ncbi:type II secretion system protein, partial [Staphylococcus aureus]
MAIINKKQSKISQAGVTLIELIVVIAIFCLISSVL